MTTTFGKQDGKLVKSNLSQAKHDFNTETCNKKEVSIKAIFYLPIILRLQRMSALFQIAGQMTWHGTMKRKELHESYAIHMMA